MWPFALLYLLINSQVATGQQLPVHLRDEFCIDNPSLTVDGYNDKGGKTYELYFRDRQQRKYQAQAKSERSDRLPDQITFLGVELFQYDIGNVNAMLSDYGFDGHFNVYAWKNGNEWRLMGFNQIWLGCPQPMCLQPHIDAAARLPNSEDISIFRGKYYWYLSSNSKTPTVQTAKDTQMVQFADCAHRLPDRVVIYKGPQYFELKGGQWTGPFNIETGRFQNSDAIVYVFDKLYYFKGKELMQVADTYQLESEFHNVDAAVTLRGNTVWVFKGRKYIEVKILNSSQSGSIIEKSADWQFTQDFFACDYSQTHYVNSANYDQVIGEYFDGKPWPKITQIKPSVPPVLTESPATQANTTENSTAPIATIEEEEASGLYMPVIIVVVIIGVVAVALYFFLLSSTQEIQERSTKKKSKKTASSDKTREVSLGTEDGEPSASEEAATATWLPTAETLKQSTSAEAVSPVAEAPAAETVPKSDAVQRKESVDKKVSGLSLSSKSKPDVKRSKSALKSRESADIRAAQAKGDRKRTRQTKPAPAKVNIPPAPLISPKSKTGKERKERSLKGKRNPPRAM